MQSCGWTTRVLRTDRCRDTRTGGGNGIRHSSIMLTSQACTPPFIMNSTDFKKEAVIWLVCDIGRSRTMQTCAKSTEILRLPSKRMAKMNRTRQISRVGEFSQRKRPVNRIMIWKGLQGGMQQAPGAKHNVTSKATWHQGQPSHSRLKL